MPQRGQTATAQSQVDRPQHWTVATQQKPTEGGTYHPCPVPKSPAYIYTHLIFSTKDRESCFSDGLRPDLRSYMVTTLANLQYPAVLIDSARDHVRVLFRLGRSVSEPIAPQVANYIQHQREYHRVKTFQEEYRDFLEKHHIDHDESYVRD